MNCDLLQVRVVEANTVRAQRTGMSLDFVLSRLLPVFEEQVLILSRRDGQARATGELRFAACRTGSAAWVVPSAQEPQATVTGSSTVCNCELAAPVFMMCLRQISAIVGLVGFGSFLFDGFQ